VVATTRTALRHVHDRGAELRARLWDNARGLHDGLGALGLELGADTSPVVAVRFKEKDRALATWRRLLALGVYTNLMMPPASPDGSSLLRCSASAAHTPEQIRTIVEAFRRAVADTDEPA
jgi:8-amino-7-oxononanoate synthase